MADSNKWKGPTVSAGATSAWLAVVGAGLWAFGVSHLAQPGGYRSATLLQRTAFGVGELFLFVGGALGLYAVVRNDGRLWGLPALALFALFALWLTGVIRHLPF